MVLPYTALFSLVEQLAPVLLLLFLRTVQVAKSEPEPSGYLPVAPGSYGNRCLACGLSKHAPVRYDRIIEPYQAQAHLRPC